MNAALVMGMNFIFSALKFLPKQKRRNLDQTYQRFSFSLCGTSIMSRIVESKIVKSVLKVCKIVLFFLILV